MRAWKKAPVAHSSHRLSVYGAKVKKAVWLRDGGRCTFESDAGHRCEARSFLEYDHIEPFARGGETTAGNLRLRCRTHNQYAADQAFGMEFMKAKRDAVQSPAS